MHSVARCPFMDGSSRSLSLSLSQAKQYLCHQIDTFLEERVIAADKLIAQHGSSKIHDGDVILTHARYDRAGSQEFFLACLRH